MKWFSASVLLSSTTGNSYVDGTKFEKNYLLPLVIKPNEKHDIQFYREPQWHHQSFANPLSDILNTVQMANQI
jgi:hypothetical protein